MKKSLLLIVVAGLAALQPVSAFAGSTDKAPLKGVRVAQMRRGEQAASSTSCRVSFGSCLSHCSGHDAGGCIMECETDCSVCVLEDSGELNSPLCERK